MKKLNLDFETRSEISLPDRGLHNYVNHPSFRVLLCAYNINETTTKLWRPWRGEPMPYELWAALVDESFEAHAFQASFERQVLARLGIGVALSRWRCSMIKARHLSISGGLEVVGQVLGLSADKAKFADGKALVRKFTIPRKPTKAKPYQWNDWTTDPDDWQRFEDYCVRDVDAEIAISNKLDAFPMTEWEWRCYVLDQKMNQAGAPISVPFVQNAIRMADRAVREAMDELREITGLANPNSTAQLLPWLQERGYPFGNLRKQQVKAATGGTPAAQRVLHLRRIVSRTSAKKYVKMLDLVCADGVLRDQFAMKGAARTGRTAGRGVQLQNLGKPSKALEEHDVFHRAQDHIVRGDYDGAKAEFGDVMDVVASCVRAAIRPPAGHFAVADLSAIEDRVTAWISRCETMLDDHRKGRDPYKSSASLALGKPIEEITKAERTLMKPVRLGCAYMLGGGEQRLDKNGDVEKTGLFGYAAAMGVDMSKEQAAELVALYRSAYPEVVKCWRDLRDAAIETIETREPRRVGYVTFDWRAPCMRIRLPSGRHLHYIRPRVETTGRLSKGEDEWTAPATMWLRSRDKDCVRVTAGQKLSGVKLVDGQPECYFGKGVTYENMNQTTNQWTRVFTHPGKLLENIVQAVATDVLWAGQLAADEAGMDIRMSVHDEQICMGGDHKELERLMSLPLEWAPGLPLAAVGETMDYYRK